MGAFIDHIANNLKLLVKIGGLAILERNRYLPGEIWVAGCSVPKKVRHRLFLGLHSLFPGVRLHYSDIELRSIEVFTGIEY